MTTSTLYKIASAPEWAAAEAVGLFTGAAVDIADGFIHFSDRDTVAETAARHFAGRDDLVLVAVAAAAVADHLRFEPSRGGRLFPHLYAPLPTSAVLWVRPLPLGGDGRHVFPEDLP